MGAEALVPGPSGRRSGWQPWIISEGQQTIALQFAESFFKEMVTPGTPIDWRQADAERDMEKMTRIAGLLNATNPDLTRFRGRGGKTIRSRPLCPYPMTAKYNGTGSKDDGASFTCALPPAASSSSRP